MIQRFLGFRPIDQLQIVLYILFALFILVGLLISAVPAAGEAVRIFLISAAARLQELTARIRDDEPFERDWMDYDRWKETRP